MLEILFLKYLTQPFSRFGNPDLPFLQILNFNLSILKVLSVLIWNLSKNLVLRVAMKIVICKKHNYGNPEGQNINFTLDLLQNSYFHVIFSCMRNRNGISIFSVRK